MIDKVEKIRSDTRRAHEYFDKKTEYLTRYPFIGFSDQVNRIRRNLLIVTSIALIYILSGATIVSFNLFGAVIEDINQNFINWLLFIFLSYHFFHFYIYVNEHLRQREFKNKSKNEIMEQIKAQEALEMREEGIAVGKLEKRKEESKRMQIIQPTTESALSQRDQREPAIREAQEVLKALRERTDFSDYKTRLDDHTKLEKLPFKNWLLIEVSLPLPLSLYAIYLLIPSPWNWLVVILVISAISYIFFLFRRDIYLLLIALWKRF